MKINRVLMILVFVFISVKSFAYESGPWTEVTQMYIKDSGSIYVFFGANGLPGCYGNNSAFLKGDNIERLYSALLAAKMAGQSVKPLYQYWNKENGSTGWDMCYVEAIYLK
ncbi:hypothetical protein [Teredinibacter turnerae]|uniref:hypothetical protein n=1 Tax=Teredinibacter turnerae TaxID=2426 RepID=UPI0030CBAAEE